MRFTDQQYHMHVQKCYIHVIMYIAHVVCCGRYKPLTGKYDTETTTGQIRQLLVELSATDVIWLTWHIDNVDKINRCIDCPSHEQKLYC